MSGLRSLRLSHYRSYVSVELAFDGRPVVLFGQNGAGKTNLLEAISMLSPGRGMRRAKPGDMARAPEALGWKIWAELEAQGEIHEVVTGSEGGAARGVFIGGKPARQLDLGRLTRVIWLVPVMDRLWLEGAAERRGFLDRITMSLDPGHGEAVIGYEKAMRERNRLLKDRAREPSWYAALEVQMARLGAAIIAGRARAVARLSAAQAGAETAFPAAVLEVVGSGPEREEDLALALAEDRIRDMEAGRTLTGPHRADLTAIYAEKEMEARLCSTGEQKALLVSLILANARALAADFGAPPILLLDEVAAHLDAGRRSALYDEICALGAQAFMSGTGPELFEALGPRAAQFEVTEAGGVSSLQAAGG